MNSYILLLGTQVLNFNFPFSGKMLWSNVGSKTWQHMLMVKEQSNCKTGMGHYGIFREVFIRSSEVLLLRRLVSAKRRLAAMALLAPAEFLPVHIISVLKMPAWYRTSKGCLLLV